MSECDHQWEPEEDDNPGFCCAKCYRSKSVEECPLCEGDIDSDRDKDRTESFMRQIIEDAMKWRASQ